MQVLIGLLLGYIMHDAIKKTPIGEFLDEVKPNLGASQPGSGLDG